MEKSAVCISISQKMQSMRDVPCASVPFIARIPLLFLQGERDYQVTMQDFGLWRSALAGKADVCFKSYAGLNHILQEGTGKSVPAEYEEKGFVPQYVIDDIANFIQKY